MNEIFDQLTVKIIFCFILFIGIVAYKIYNSAYLSGFTEYWKKSYDLNHPAILIYSFSRIFGLSIILSGLNFLKNTTVALNIFHFFFWSLFILVLYILSVYVIESIILYNFNTRDELFKKMNLTFATISMSIGLSTAIIMKKTILESNHSLILFIILWLAGLVLLGCAGRIFEYVSKLKFNKLVIQKNMAIAISYSGYFIGCAEMISTCFSNNSPDVTTFASSSFLKFLLCLIIFPIFMIGIKNIFPVSSPQVGQLLSMEEFLDHHEPPTPTAINLGATWYKPSTGVLYRWVNDGTTSLWLDVSTAGGSVIPTQTGNSGKYLSTNGTTASWTAVPSPDAVPTNGSMNPVSSDGVFDALALKQNATETVYALAGTEISAANGTIQEKTLSGSTTLTETLTSGQSVTLHITMGANALTFPALTWLGGTPTITHTGVSVFELWKAGTTLRGAYLGEA